MDLRFLFIVLGMTGLSVRADDHSSPQQPSLKPAKAKADDRVCARGAHGLDPEAWQWIKIKSLRATVNGVPAPASPEAKKYNFYVNGTYFDYRPGKDFDFILKDAKALRGFMVSPTPKGIDKTPPGTIKQLSQARKKLGTYPLGTFMTNGHIANPIDSRSPVFNRGGLAQLDDGKLVFCNPAVAAHRAGRNISVINTAALNAHCGGSGHKVTEYIGGAMALVANGRRACVGPEWSPPPCDQSIDLLSVQRHRPMGDPYGDPIGDDEDLMRANATHLVIAQKKGEFYIAWNTAPRNGRQIQNEFCNAAFTEVYKYDGGSGFCVMALQDEKASKLKLPPRLGCLLNPTGFLVQTD